VACWGFANLCGGGGGCGGEGLGCNGLYVRVGVGKDMLDFGVKHY